MPWSANDYPDSMKHLSPEVRRKAISIANGILESGGEEGTAIATGISRAKEHHEKKGTSKGLNRSGILPQTTIREATLKLALMDDEETEQTQSDPGSGSKAFAGALTAAELPASVETEPTDPTLHIEGFGLLTRSQIEQGLKDRIGQLNAAVARDDWSTVNYFLTNGVIKAMIETLRRHQKTGIWYDPDSGTVKKLSKPPEEW